MDKGVNPPPNDSGIQAPQEVVTSSALQKCLFRIQEQLHQLQKSVNQNVQEYPDWLSAVSKIISNLYRSYEDFGNQIKVAGTRYSIQKKAFSRKKEEIAELEAEDLEKKIVQVEQDENDKYCRLIACLETSKKEKELQKKEELKNIHSLKEKLRKITEETKQTVDKLPKLEEKLKKEKKVINDLDAQKQGATKNLKDAMTVKAKSKAEWQEAYQNVMSNEEEKKSKTTLEQEKTQVHEVEKDLMPLIDQNKKLRAEIDFLSNTKCQLSKRLAYLTEQKQNLEVALKEKKEHLLSLQKVNSQQRGKSQLLSDTTIYIITELTTREDDFDELIRHLEHSIKTKIEEANKLQCIVDDLDVEKKALCVQLMESKLSFKDSSAELKTMEDLSSKLHSKLLSVIDIKSSRMKQYTSLEYELISLQKASEKEENALQGRLESLRHEHNKKKEMRRSFQSEFQKKQTLLKDILKELDAEQHKSQTRFHSIKEEIQDSIKREEELLYRKQMNEETVIKLKAKLNAVKAILSENQKYLDESYNTLLQNRIAMQEQCNNLQINVHNDERESDELLEYMQSFEEAATENYAKFTMLKKNLEMLRTLKDEEESHCTGMSEQLATVDTYILEHENNNEQYLENCDDYVSNHNSTIQNLNCSIEESLRLNSELALKHRKLSYAVLHLKNQLPVILSSKLLQEESIARLKELQMIEAIMKLKTTNYKTGRKHYGERQIALLHHFATDQAHRMDALQAVFCNDISKVSCAYQSFLAEYNEEVARARGFLPAINTRAAHKSKPFSKKYT